MANLFSTPKAPRPQVVYVPPAPEPPPPPPEPPPPPPAPPPPPEPEPAPEPAPPAAGAPGPGASDPADDAAGLLTMRRERSRMGTVATSWRGVLLADGARPARKRLLGE